MSRAAEPHLTFSGPSLLHARLFGAAHLAVGDRVIRDDAWSPRGGRALLLLLLATPAHRLPRERIEDALWPGLSPRSARNASHKALHDARRVLEPGLPPRHPGSFFVSDAALIALVPGAIDLDVDEFERLLASARLADDDGARPLLQAALALYQGPLLGRDPSVEALIARRDHLHRAWHDAALRLATIDLRAGNPQEAVRCLLPVAEEEPASEEAQRLLIQAHDRAGRRDLARRQYERLAAALRDELGVEPSLETQRLAARMIEPEWKTRPRSAGERAWGRVPAPPSRLIGREAELDLLQRHLTDPALRLVTLLGTGGVGKTRLAIEAARAFPEEFSAGACFVNLAPIRDPALVITAIAHALAAPDDPGLAPFERVVRIVGDQDILLVLDNLEHLLDAAPVVADLLAACPGLKILVTSREALRLRAEMVVPVEPLPVPETAPGAVPTVSAVRAAAAVELFVERAAAAAPGFAVTEANVGTIAHICRGLNGLPLAIELAAARCRELSLDALHARLARRLDLLVDGYRDLPDRQQTMRQTIAWSYDLLEDELRHLFRRLALLPGGSSVELAARLEGVALEEARRRLDALAGKSLLRWRDVERVEMLETAREFGLEMLAAAGDSAAAREIVAAYALDLTAEAVPHLAGPEQGRWLDRLEAEDVNMREALAWAIADEDADRALALAANLWRYWWCRGPISEGRVWLERALALPQPPLSARRGEALQAAAALAESQGDFSRSLPLREEALALWTALGEPAEQARALSGLGMAAAHRGDYDAARGFHERALALATEAGDAPGIARALDRLGTVARHQGDLARAKACYAESLERFRAIGDQVNASIVLSNLGEACYLLGELERAASLFEEALALQRSLDIPDGIAFDLTNLARVRLALGELERAAALSAQGIRLFRDQGNELGLAGAMAVFAMACHALGDRQRAARYLTESLRILARIDARSAMPEQLEQLATVLLDSGEPVTATRLLGAAAALREAIAAPLAPASRVMVESALRSGRAALGEEHQAAFAAGRAMTIDQILAGAGSPLTA